MDTWIVHFSLIYKTCKQTKCSLTVKWNVVVQSLYAAIKKNEILPFVTLCMDLEGIMLSEISDRERQILYALTYTFAY